MHAHAGCRGFESYPGQLFGVVDLFALPRDFVDVYIPLLLSRKPLWCKFSRKSSEFVLCRQQRLAGVPERASYTQVW